MSDRPRSGMLRKLEADHLKASLNENPYQTQIQLAGQFGADQAIVLRRIHEMGKIQLGKCVPHELLLNNIIRWLSTRVSLLSRQCRKIFCGKLLLATKNRLCVIILNADICW